jgi:hypothetical protein
MSKSETHPTHLNILVSLGQRNSQGPILLHQSQHCFLHRARVGCGSDPKEFVDLGGNDFDLTRILFDIVCQFQEHLQNVPLGLDEPRKLFGSVPGLDQLRITYGSTGCLLVGTIFALGRRIGWESAPMSRVLDHTTGTSDAALSVRIRKSAGREWVFHLGILFDVWDKYGSVSGLGGQVRSETAPYGTSLESGLHLPGWCVGGLKRERERVQEGSESYILPFTDNSKARQ